MVGLPGVGRGPSLQPVFGSPVRRFEDGNVASMQIDIRYEPPPGDVFRDLRRACGWGDIDPAVAEAALDPNAAQLAILMALDVSTGGIGGCPCFRRGKVLILRFAARGLRRVATRTGGKIVMRGQRGANRSSAACMTIRPNPSAPVGRRSAFAAERDVPVRTGPGRRDDRGRPRQDDPAHVVVCDLPASRRRSSPARPSDVGRADRRTSRQRLRRRPPCRLIAKRGAGVPCGRLPRTLSADPVRVWRLACVSCRSRRTHIRQELLDKGFQVFRLAGKLR